MFPAGCTQVNSSLASPDHTGPGLGLREAALPLAPKPCTGPPGSASWPPGHLIPEKGRASDLPETRLTVVSHRRGLDGAGRSS